MKRHKCYICKQKREERNLTQVISIGKNEVAYNSWICKTGSWRRYSKNYDTMYGDKLNCEIEHKKRMRTFRSKSPYPRSKK